MPSALYFSVRYLVMESILLIHFPQTESAQMFAADAFAILTTFWKFLLFNHFLLLLTTERAGNSWDLGNSLFLFYKSLCRLNTEIENL